MDKSDDAKTNITDKLSQIYSNTLISSTIKKDSFKVQLTKRLQFFKKKLENKNKTNKKRGMLGNIGTKFVKTIKNLKGKKKETNIKKV